MVYHAHICMFARNLDSYVYAHAERKQIYGHHMKQTCVYRNYE